MEKITNQITFGTDGWRAIMGETFTDTNLKCVLWAVSQWMEKNELDPVVVIGHDCRANGNEYAALSANVLAGLGIKCYLPEGFVSTPMVSLATKQLNASIGIVLTASHNPPAYNGFKLKGAHGGPLSPAKVSEVQAMIPDELPASLKSISADSKTHENIEHVDLESMYVAAVENSFDMDMIRSVADKIAYDAMYGAGQQVMKRMFPEMTFLHCEQDPTFGGLSPEPIEKNLAPFSKLMSSRKDLKIGLATDGDADRIGLLDENGTIVDSHHILLLLIHYLKKYKSLDGLVCTGFSSTVKIGTICKHYGLPLKVVPIGFKHISATMVEQDVLVGGEESGGISVAGHIPERDGIWIGLTLVEFLAKTGKSLHELIQEVYQITGSFAYAREDLRIDEAKKQEVLLSCKEGGYKKFGSHKIIRIEDMDGYKYFLNEENWLMIRASGTEPVLRIYAEANSKDHAIELIRSAKKELSL